MLQGSEIGTVSTLAPQMNVKPKLSAFARHYFKRRGLMAISLTATALM
jgi:hypothetical protein